MSKLIVPFFKQDTDYTCGPTSLQMILAYYGVRKSEDHLAKILKTTDDAGTCRVAMYETAVELGFHCYVNDNASLAEINFFLELGVPPIVRFIEPNTNDDHYGVVVQVDDEALYIHDPWNGPNQRYATEAFIKRWTCDTIGDCNQWLMAVAKDPLPLGRQFHPHE